MGSKIDTGRIHAVITGDIIGFKKLPLDIRKNMHHTLRVANRELRSAFPGLLPYDISVFRGDGWQMLLADPVMALRAALLTRGLIRSSVSSHRMDTRLAIGIGGIDYVPENHVTAGDGEAYRCSGKLLSEMDGTRQGTMRYAYPGVPEASALDAIVRLTGALADRWSDRMASAMVGVLQGKNQDRIAGEWSPPVTRQAVGKHLERAAWPAIRQALEIFETLQASFSGPQQVAYRNRKKFNMQ